MPAIHSQLARVEVVHKVLVFTATYNEAANIGPWIEGVAQAIPSADILIIDDSSPDHTANVITESARTYPQVRLHSRAGKQGLSSAHIYAMQYALDNGYDALVTMDADGSHQPAQIPAVLGALTDGLSTANFCIGTRTRGGSHQAALPRRVLSHGANITARVLLPMGISEYTTSFRAFDPIALRAVLAHDFSASGYAFFIECLEVMHRAGVIMTEVPIDFLDRFSGQSKIPKNQIYLSMLALTRLSFNRLKQRG
ncbi:MAG: glycosyltransferase [Actinomycetia bacterium]|jgi:dolichol-phosphate mannosyltransferase|nr:glycosyltransferase [Actinomycetes bacterium]